MRLMTLLCRACADNSILDRSQATWLPRLRLNSCRCVLLPNVTATTCLINQPARRSKTLAVGRTCMSSGSSSTASRRYSPRAKRSQSDNTCSTPTTHTQSPTPQSGLLQTATLVALAETCSHKRPNYHARSQFEPHTPSEHLVQAPHQFGTPGTPQTVSAVAFLTWPSSPSCSALSAKGSLFSKAMNLCRLNMVLNSRLLCGRVRRTSASV